MCRLLIALTLLLAAATARAQDLWRIVDVVPLPGNAAPLSAAALALRGTGIAFVEDAVKGPAPLACQHAVVHTFSNGHVSDILIGWSTAFGGGLSPERIDAVAKLVGIVGDAFAVRVECDGRTFDYYHGDYHRALLFDGALLILDKPLDEDQIKDVDDWVKPLRPGFDCTQARSTSERSACTDYRLSVAYRRMADAYAGLRDTVGTASFATIRDAQRGWIPYVAVLCNAAGPLPEQWTDRRDLAACLRDAADERADLLAAEVLTAGQLRLEPRMHAIYRHAPPLEDAIIYPFLIGQGADGFNRLIAGRLAPSAPYLTKERMASDDYDGPMHARRSYSVVAFTSRLISITLVTDAYGGGAHGSLSSTAINFDPRRGRAVTLADVFRPGSAWRKAVTDFCLDSLSDERESFEKDRVPVVVADPGAWTFDSDGAHVFFDVGTIASYSGGASDVTIPYDKLRPYLRPDAPLP